MDGIWDRSIVYTVYLLTLFFTFKTIILFLTQIIVHLPANKTKKKKKKKKKNEKLETCL